MLTDLPADLHLHTTLSPCADRSMTPRNLVAAALRSGLAVIGVTDHNAAANAPAVAAAVAAAGLWLIPGMEIQTREEVHLLCYFRSVQDLLDWEAGLQSFMPELPNDERYFGPQEIYGTDGFLAGSCPRLLLTSVDLGVEQVFQKVEALDGLCLPAHVDRPSFGLLGQLGMMPPVFPPARPLELSAHAVPADVVVRFNLPPGTRFYPSSDAHHPEEIGRARANLRVAAADWQEFKAAVSGEDGRDLAYPPYETGM